MKRVYLLCILTILIINAFSQVELLIRKNDGGYILGEYISKTSDNLIIKSSKKEMSLNFNEIRKVQTLDVHFLQDAYTNELSKKYKILEYDKIGSFNKWGVFISAREIENEIIILFKYVWSHQDALTDWPVIEDDNILKCILMDGSEINLSFKESYILRGHRFYNFGYVKLNEKEIAQFIHSPVNKIIYDGNDFKSINKYLIMRQLFAIFDENMGWRYLTP
ncbi:MAG: hypothetical protein R6W71_07495 [Bacteroidales bacterium]